MTRGKVSFQHHIKDIILPCSLPKWIYLEIKQFLFAVYLLPFMGLTQYFLGFFLFVRFLFCFIVLPGFLCKILIHAGNSYLAMWQEFKIFMHFQKCMYIKEAPFLFEFLMLPINLIGINLYSYRLMPKIVILNILWYCIWLLFLFKE